MSSVGAVCLQVDGGADLVRFQLRDAPVRPHKAGALNITKSPSDLDTSRGILAGVAVSLLVYLLVGLAVWLA